MKGKISISKVTVTGLEVKPGDEDYICIEVEDTASSISFLKVQINLLNFAKAITGLSNVPITFDLRGIENIGKSLEVKTERVFITSKESYDATDEEIRLGIQKYEGGGWIGRDSDARNHHNWAGTGHGGYYVRINYHRYVDKENNGAL